MDSKQRIVAYLSKNNAVTGRELREHLGVTRQALSVHLAGLIEAGRVIRLGMTRGARYTLPGREPAPVVLSRILLTKGLQEDQVWSDLSRKVNLGSSLRPNVEAIVRYGFTEILNNAIEHSEADRCLVRFRLEAGLVSFQIRDPGIGAFHSIASKLRFPDEDTALVELTKGRTTTMREAHTGEGIFFSSRAADRLVLRSHRIRIEWNQAKDDVFVSSQRFMTGTEVLFSVRRDSRRRLEQVFAEYSPEEYDFRFERTKVFVKLLGKDYVSRSEARRLVANLEKFREIVLDFRDVTSVGQGFVDEVFRVFARREPGILIRTENANAAVEAMVRHARAESSPGEWEEPG